MKILAVHSALAENENKQSQVDHWRIYRPLRELAKHVDWQIDHQPTFIPGFEKYASLEEFTEDELAKAMKRLGSYDIVFSSYQADIAAYLLLKIVRDRFGTQQIIDVDDDMFAVNEDNPYWLKMDDEKTWRMQVMIRENDWISTTMPYLAERFRERRRRDPAGHEDDSVFVLPNCIPDDYQHPPFDNSPDIVIGYAGGSSHYADLHQSGVVEAVRRVMHENKNVRFRAIAMPVDAYLPRGRYELVEGKRGSAWINELFPSMKLDIGVCPILENVFNRGKSDIKWQEYTRAGAVVVATDLEPYQGIPEDCIVRTANDEDSWYKALSGLVNSSLIRKKQLKKAREELSKRRMEVNWQMYRDMFIKVKEHKDANYKTGK